MSAELTATIQFLKKFESLQGRVAIAPSEKGEVIQALKKVQDQSDFQIFGILADTYEEAIATLADFAPAFGYEVPPNPNPADAPIYLKYNPSTRLCYCDTYKGEHRGVLISFQSDFVDGLNEMLGHFPLDLYR